MPGKLAKHDDRRLIAELEARNECVRNDTLRDTLPKDEEDEKHG